jgi:CheY-like chemotaxis protein
MAETLTILCVDEDEDALFIASLSLGLDPDVSVIVARSGPIALDLLKMSSVRMSAILVEARMSDMSGTALLSIVRQTPAFAAIPVIFLTASVSRAEAALYQAAGAAGIIAKPYDPITLADDVRRVLARTGPPEPHAAS